jgi:hypothetical protein
MLWTIAVVLGILWLLGFSFQAGGGLAPARKVVSGMWRRESGGWR